MKFHHRRFVLSKSLPTIMPDATKIGIRQELKGILFCGGKGVSESCRGDSRAKRKGRCVDGSGPG
jgi:hypothetical protein